MSKWYEVVIETHKVFVVEVDDAETADDAQKYAMDEMRFEGDPNVTDWDLIPRGSIEVAKQCADEILPL